MKLIKEQKIIELAKMDGWLDVKEYTYNYDYMGEKGEYKQIQGRSLANLGHLVGPPPYLTSYDAIIPLVQKQDEHTRKSILPISFMSTPEQIADALLKAKGFEV